jgi:tRNA pseudouridine55 synthase
MARRRTHGRPVNGILLLDKPMGATSNAALQQVKRLFQARKAGHTGSLDPLATGVLPICLGEATKASAFLLDADKRYRVVCKLGETTSTQDAEGEILQTRPVGDYSLAELEVVLDRFRGPQEQVPPMFSAVKHEGQRLYKLARQGIEVERKARSIVIHELSLLSWESPSLEIEVHCSKGTYVRTLAEDIGEALGCGAHVTGLRRTAVGPYGDDTLVTIEQLEALSGEGFFARLDALLLPMESALAQWPGVRLTGDAAFYLRQGQPVLVPKAPTSGWVRLYEGESTFLGMGEILDDGRVAPRRLMKTA